MGRGKLGPARPAITDSLVRREIAKSSFGQSTFRAEGVAHFSLAGNGKTGTHGRRWHFSREE